MSKISDDTPDESKSTQEASQATTGKTSLGHSAIKGVFWVGGGQAVKQVIAISSSIALARILAPDDFGVFAMIFFAMEVAQVFADFGLGAAVVQRRVSDSLTLSTLFWLNLGFAGIAALLLVASGPMLAIFFSQPVLTWLAIGCALNILIACSMVIPQALLSQRLDFRTQSQAQIMGSAVGATAAVGSAVAGAGVWSFMVQPLVGTTVTLLLIIRAVGWRPGLEFEYQRARGMISFGVNLLAGNIVQSLGKNLHNIILGRYLGAAPLGYYNMAHGVTYFPIYQVSAVVVKVLFPTLVGFGDDVARLRAAYEKVLAAIALVTFPCMAGLFSVADDFVAVVFGEKWLDMIPVLKILCWVVMLQSVATTASTVLLSKGLTKIMLHLSITSTILTGIGILIGSQWGLTGTAWGWAAAATIYYLLLTSVAYREIGLSMWGFLRAVRGPLMAALGMTAVLAFFAPLTDSIAIALRLPLAILIGAISYAILTLILNRQNAFAVLKLLRSVLATKT